MTRRPRAGAAPLAFAFALLLGACAGTPQREAAVEAPAPARGDGVVARDDRFVVVVARPGDTLDSLAARWLGDAAARSAIAEFNGVDEARSGELLAIPLRPRDPKGVGVAGAQAVTILCYHRFGPKAAPLTVTPQAFDAQMGWLAKQGYHVIPASRLAGFLEGRESLPPKSVVVTIDDGYRSTYEMAWPVLRKYGFPATVFLYSDFVGAPDALTWAQMREMTASGQVAIQPHSKTHANLTLRLPDETDARYKERIRREVATPADQIQKELGARPLAFAFPYGDVNDTVADELRARGIPLGMTVTPGGNPFYAPPFMLRRTMIYGGDDLEAFKAKLVSTVGAGRS